MRTIKLCKGMGKKDKSHCVMAATSIVAEEPFSDHPKCVCPTITRFLLKINDSYYTDKQREEDLSHLPWLIIGTNGDLKTKIVRAKLFADYATDAAAKYTLVFSADITDYADKAVNAADAAAAEYTAVNAAAAAKYTATYATDAAAYTATVAILTDTRKEAIKFLEEKIITVYTTMPIELNYNFNKLWLNY